MKPAVPERRPVTLTIAGSDAGGGAGIQADLKTMEAAGAFATSAITAVTAQNTTGVNSSYVLPIDEIAAQCDAVFDDFDVRAIKTGMLATAEVIELVTERVAGATAPAVVDPVMVATTGDRLLDAEAEDAYEALIAESTLVTPNADEAEVLTDTSIETTAEARHAGDRIVEMGADAALVKGGHLHEDEARVVDVLVSEGDVVEFEQPRIETPATHGSGCTLSSVIAARLARGDSLVDAVEWGTSFMQSAVRYHHDVGHGDGAVHHLVELRNRADGEATAERLADFRTLVDEQLTGPDGAQWRLAAASAYAETEDDIATTAVENAVSGGRAAETRRRADSIAPRLLGVRDAIPGVRFAASGTGVDPAISPDRSYRAADDRRGACRECAETVDKLPLVFEEQGEPTVYSVFGENVESVVRGLTALEDGS